jgi:Tfp pilus assembly protein PilF
MFQRPIALKQPLIVILLVGLSLSVQTAIAQPSSRQVAAMSAESVQLLKIASEEFDKHEYEAAIHEISDAIVKSPKADYLYLFRGTADNALGNRRKAIEDYTKLNC